MLVTFHTKAWSSVTLFGDIAVTLLKMAGHSGSIPGALRSEDITVTVKRLQQALAATPDAKTGTAKPSRANDADAEPAVSLRLRAYPLIELLSAAAQQECDVSWEAGAPVI